MTHSNGKHRLPLTALGLLLCCSNAFALIEHDEVKVASASNSVSGKSLSVTIEANGDYSIVQPNVAGVILRSGVEADLGSGTVFSSSYPEHQAVQSEFDGQFGHGTMLTITHTGLANTPGLICMIKVYRDQPWAELEVAVRNTSSAPIQVKAIRSVHASEGGVIDLGGRQSADRILSDSYSEDRPQLAIRDLGAAPTGVHRAFGTQLIYNRESGRSLFIGALTSDRLLTIFHLYERAAGPGSKIVSYEAVATGTTEIMKEESLKKSPAAEQVEISLPVNPGESLSGERLMIAAGGDYHAQLEEYGSVVRQIHKARVDTPAPMGWWSWTAFYFGLNEGAAITNAKWLSENLKSSGYTYFQMDEGYQYARGEYTTADAALFPHGIHYVAQQVTADGLRFGVWTAPFEVSERAWVYQNHKDWLLHNSAGELIHIGFVTDKDSLYVLDTTNPGAQAYLKQTYATLHDWGVRFIKMDFMDDSAVEGAYFRPNTTAFEAQRIGLHIIRDAVGEDTVLDKDGSAMLNPVGIVDAGRISQDTGHTFGATRDAASGIAARYYMDRNFYVSDPDAFTVSTQTVDDQSWHGGQHPLTLEEAKASISLAAVAGGMFELGDDLPTLNASPDRVALTKNKDLLDMARLSRASVPTDLMTYSADDLQPSIFLLREDPRQSILTVFNWSEHEMKRSLDLKALGLRAEGGYKITEVFGAKDCCDTAGAAITFVQPRHSVRVFKLVDESVPVVPPSFEVKAEANAKAGASLVFEEISMNAKEPVISCHWDFGDGTSADGTRVTHAYTHSGNEALAVTVTGIDGRTATKKLQISIASSIPTRFDPAKKMRAE